MAENHIIDIIEEHGYTKIGQMTAWVCLSIILV